MNVSSAAVGKCQVEMAGAGLGCLSSSPFLAPSSFCHLGDLLQTGGSLWKIPQALGCYSALFSSSSWQKMFGLRDFTGASWSLSVPRPYCRPVSSRGDPRSWHSFNRHWGGSMAYPQCKLDRDSGLLAQRNDIYHHISDSI